MFKKILAAIIFLSVYTSNSWGQKIGTAFTIIPLGVKGGDDESNLSSYMIAPKGSANYVCLDAGTINAGIQKAIEYKSLRGISEEIQRKQIKGYLISHAHLDHVAGLIINSPADTSKNIYGIPSVLNILRDKYFTWDAWANFANEGEKPQLKKYIYSPLNEGETYPLDGTEMKVRVFELSHGNPYKSTAFLISHNDSYVLYLGDTGADEIEKSDKLANLWQTIAPIINAGQLKAIFLEVSFPNEQPDKQLFGHLTPKLFYSEIGKLKSLTDGDAIKKVSFIVTHIKPPQHSAKKIKQQLLTENILNLNLIFPKQGKLLTIN
ncbi:3',5'-cyclic-nucleotide phosphodiesterase [Pedobacter sp. ISL-68]|uniref:MBL fold metallo-hydrolase n=1 Tax=unclassified Pedobacter TaxID=2628915 RepID=UPI001BECB182|nr:MULTISPECIES: 3',5'-cyclic-nucleotide phosphodiesterase [unclassified Pedobacter]MBT2562325.1 3',5'-cyclic-nucleotide phosphodiesterase [Pedobacter sp. ISL-64]MBT2588904.1 3',5'-cyclic-nucleotide phosphodiesterase [Pedobacter sp. ISL-68]